MKTWHMVAVGVGILIVLMLLGVARATFDTREVSFNLGEPGLIPVV